MATRRRNPGGAGGGSRTIPGYYPLTQTERDLCLALADKITELGFPDDADMIRDYVNDEESARVEGSITRYLGALAQDVWWHYGHVGEEETKPIYVEAEAYYHETIKVLRALRGRT